MPLWHKAICKESEKELETLIQIIRIYNQDIAIEFGNEKFFNPHNEKRERKTVKGIELLNQESVRTLGEKELIHTGEYWKQTPSNKWK